MPDLEELEMSPNLGHDLPDLLQAPILDTTDKTRMCLCPKLQVVQLTVDSTRHMQALYDFIESRWSIGDVHRDRSRFESLSIRLFGTRLFEEAWDNLKKFQDDGLDIFVANFCI